MKWFGKKRAQFRLLFDDSSPLGNDEYQKNYPCAECFKVISVAIKKGITFRQIAEKFVCPHCGCCSVKFMSNAFIRVMISPPPAI